MRVELVFPAFSWKLYLFLDVGQAIQTDCQSWDRGEPADQLFTHAAVCLWFVRVSLSHLHVFGGAAEGM